MHRKCQDYIQQQNVSNTIKISSQTDVISEYLELYEILVPTETDHICHINTRMSLIKKEGDKHITFSATQNQVMIQTSKHE